MAWNLTTLAMTVPLLILLIGLTVTVSIDPYISRKHRRVMLLIIALSVVLLAQNLLEGYLANGPFRWFWRTTLSVIGYTLRPVFLILFLYIIRPGKKYLACWGLAVLNWALQMTAYFSHLCFWIGPDNHYHSGPLHSACLVISLLLLAYCLFQSLRNYRASQKQDILLPLLVVLVLLASVFLDVILGLDLPVPTLTYAIVIGCVFYYIWLHLRFVRDHEDALMMRQRVQIMLSQIQPHFLYNTLGAIREMCTDPEAKKAIGRFTRYLQGNMDALAKSGTIPFGIELEHTKAYLELEQMRFESALRVEYDIACTDFELPTLTLQPIAENAVRHGARGTERGEGTVTIATREYPDRYELTVSDNGPGFDPEHPMPKDDGRAHIGIQNVRERLRDVCGGELRIASEIGKGTRVTLVLPKKEREVPC